MRWAQDTPGHSCASTQDCSPSVAGHGSDDAANVRASSDAADMRVHRSVSSDPSCPACRDLRAGVSTGAARLTRCQH